MQEKRKVIHLVIRVSEEFKYFKSREAGVPNQNQIEMKENTVITVHSCF